MKARTICSINIDDIDSLTSFIQNGFYNNYTDMGKKVDQFFSRLACMNVFLSSLDFKFKMKIKRIKIN